MNIRVFKTDLSTTNKLLERIALALEALSPQVPDTEISEVVIDEVDGYRERDESEGLDEVREELRESF